MITVKELESGEERELPADTECILWHTEINGALTLTESEARTQHRVFRTTLGAVAIGAEVFVRDEDQADTETGAVYWWRSEVTAKE